MSQISAIEWTDSTWNCVVGCTKVSSGCANCYPILDALRMGANPNAKVSAVYRGLAFRQDNGLPNWTGVVRCLPDRLAIPFTWPSSKRVFVNSQSDLFHEAVSLDFIRRVFAVMAATPWHTYQILTKRASRLEALARELPWPGNVWMGVSVENQDAAWRIEHLRRVPAAVRFLSVEPMLGPVKLDLADLHWVITGGESGPRSRPFDPGWALAVRDQCHAAGVCFFHKQHGGRNKKATGRLLDGRTYDEMPPVSSAPVPTANERKAIAARLVADADTRVSLEVLL
jgi:protein gp37